MRTKKGISLIKSYLDPGELSQIKKVSIKFSATKFAVLSGLFNKKSKRYFLKVTYADHSERLIPISELEKEAIKQSITAFNFTLQASTVSK